MANTNRSRVYYGNLNTFIGQANATGYHFSSGTSGVNLISQFQRVQSFSENWSITRQDVNQLGKTARIDAVILEQPVATFTQSTLLADVSNERKAGLYTSGDLSCITNILAGNDEKNIFIAIAPQGQDNFGYTGQGAATIMITNATLTSYSAAAEVGGFATADFGFEGLNWAVATGTINQELKAVNPVNGQTVTGINFTIPVGISGSSDAVAALRPGDVTVNIQDAALGIETANFPIQSFNLSFDLARENLQKLGSRFAYAKVPTLPITVSASVVGNMADFNTGNLSDILCNDKSYDLTFTLREPACTGSGPVAVQYQVKGVKIDSEDASSSVGDTAAQFTINYSCQIGSPTDLAQGVFISGKQGF
jgi:hypothetical protein